MPENTVQPYAAEETSCPGHYSVQDKVSLGICVLGFLIAAGFGLAATTIQQNLSLATADAIAALFFAGLAVWVAFRPSTMAPRWFLVSFICILFYYYFVTGGADSFGFLWGIMIPIIVPFFLGYKIGLIVTVVYLLIFIATMLWGKFLFPSFSIEPSFTMMRYFAEYIVAGIIVSVYEYGQTHDKMAISEEIEKREASDQRYRLLFNNSPEAIMVLESGIFIDCNRVAEIFLGCSRTQIIGQSPISFSPELQPDGNLSAKAAEKMIKKAYTHGRCNFEWRHRRLNGEEFWASVALAATNMDGRPILLATCHDINERKKAEEKLAGLYAETERVNRLMAGREDRVIELKKEINAQCRLLKQEIAYPSVEEEA